ncbi:glucose-1-phosphate thymidylyltransferase [Candidatus Nitrosopelagicus brevis]|uniref:Glucose-1-phosphate thymidylyltransferase n=1 Tax=Candidatus Nitrosopelagicus brevis TaxID=1410606 RepID=A0A0A7V0U8_9ARCH|nr:glucose-1-phosphate thymidylyltransferase [Candidatus Nitrosopelagicus brevis]AJA91826.1 glucose-1-phosphate thymidylyltransferase [Candidatus Nitrosopelagicus brevis]MAR69768.1 glucose-1-phosphate thymidylyltransferase [Nitrospina sp.]PTL87415.1 glucose-1-phosphate thymidylyltransferase [Candidatus Nitrosopelagicus brevis]|tara:strand:+ start:3622 stop:4689 length:1068 start_codon:yes stop_codon:yes gene_type:complete
MKGIILHGGHGTRLRPLTHTGPKQLLPIANKPMSEYCLNSIKETGITDIAIIIGGLGSKKVKEYYGNGENFGVKITYVEQDEPRGIAHAINLCKDFINNEKFLVFLGDNIIQRSISDFVKNFDKSNFDATLLLCEVDNPSRFGIAEIKNKKIIKIVEKPKNPLSNLAVTGIYLLTPKIFEIIENLKPSWRNELEITDALDILLNKNNNLSFEIITDYWKDTGTPQDIIHANGEVIKNLPDYFYGKKSENMKLVGKVLTGKNSIIEKNVIITGPVIIGENCQINSGVIIGPNTSIGNNSIINQGNIENSIIMENCEINSSGKIRDSIISNNSKIIQPDKPTDEKIFLLGEGTRIYL